MTAEHFSQCILEGEGGEEMTSGLKLGRRAEELFLVSLNFFGKIGGSRGLKRRREVEK